MSMPTETIRKINDNLKNFLYYESYASINSLVGKTAIYEQDIVSLLQERFNGKYIKKDKSIMEKSMFKRYYFQVLKKLIEKDDVSILKDVIESLEGIPSKQLANIISEGELDFSKHFYLLSSKLKDKEFVIEMLKLNKIGPTHDKNLIMNFRSFFYEDSAELRELIFDNPIIYDKLSKAGNKPNFSVSFLKQMISIKGSKFFVSRLNNDLKNDENFMRSIIIDDPVNLFRGNASDYKRRIRENAFAIFGDSFKPLNEEYGFKYIVSNISSDFMDFYSYFNYNYGNAEFLGNNIEKLFTKKEEKRLFLRGKMPGTLYKKRGYRVTDDFKRALIWNFNEENIPFDQTLIDTLAARYNDRVSQLAENTPDEVMPLANNVVACYKNDTFEEFDQIMDIEHSYFDCIIDMNILSKELIKKIGIQNIQKLAYYPNSLFILSQLIKEEKTEQYVSLLSNKPESNLAPALDVNILLYTTYMYSEAINDLMSKGLLTSENVQRLIDITRNNKLLKIKSAEDVIDYNSNLQKFCDEQIVDCKDVNYAKELLFAKILKTNRAHAQELIVKFKDGLKNVNNANYEVLDLLLVIDSLQDIDAIKHSYHQLSKIFPLKNKTFQEIESYLKKQIIGNEFIPKQSFVFDEKSDMAKHVKDLSRETGVDCILLDPTADVQMLVHVLGAYGTLPKNSSIKESWNTVSKSNSSGICTTEITNDTLQTAIAVQKKPALILGFYNEISSEEVLMSAPYDIWSRSARLYPDSLYNQSYHNSRDLPNYCRKARGPCNEIVISRYKGDKKRQPDCIVSFLHQKNGFDPRAVEVAKQFGVPLVFIDEDAFLKTAEKKIEKKISNYINAPSVEKAKELYTYIETIKYGYENLEGVETSFKNSWEYQSLIVEKLSEKSKKDFETFVLEEEKKKKVKQYEREQEKSIETGKKDVSLATFKELRKNYSVIESLKLIELKKQNQTALTNQPSIEEMLEGDFKHGKK